MNNIIRLLIAIAIPLIIILLPSSVIPIEGLTTVQHRMIGLFVMAALFWILEPIPVYATSVMIITLQLIMVSDSSFVLFRGGEGEAQFGTLLDYREIMATFASPIILLFLGGFFLAMAATKYRLDTNLARALLKPFGKNPKFIMLGLMLITAIFSMFMSNTATTAMMLAILTPVLGVFDKEDPGRIGFVLAIPVAANIGGIGTPIGTPPNAIALKYLTDELSITFGTWMMFAVPYVLVMLLFSWFVLLSLFAPRGKEIELNIKGKFLKTWKAYVVYFTFAGTVLLWLFGNFTGMKSYVVAMLPVSIFSVTQILTKEDLKRISWDVLWLVAGGIALGVGLEKSGLSQQLVENIPFATFSPIFIVLLCVMTTFALANFMSNTATANLLLPIVAALGVNLSILEPLGGSRMIILACTFAASLSMSLPISTPPNAIAYASGYIENKHLMITGVTIGIVGLLGTFGMLYILKQIHFF